MNGFKSHIEPFFKRSEKKKRRNDFNDECRCFDEYKKTKNDANRFVVGFSGPWFLSNIYILSYFFKCDRRGSCADSPAYDDNGQSIGWNAINDCKGKICRYKCRCKYRFLHTYAERHAYRQITHVWDGGTDYYTGCNLKKYTKKQSIKRRFTAYQSKMNVEGRSGSVLLAVKKFKQKYSI